MGIPSGACSGLLPVPARPPAPPPPPALSGEHPFAPSEPRLLSLLQLLSGPLVCTHRRRVRLEPRRFLMRSFKIGRASISVGRAHPDTLRERGGVRMAWKRHGHLSGGWAPGVSVLYVHKAR